MTTPSAPRQDWPAFGAPAAGRLLVATPVIDEPTFARTVVLLLDHDDEGSLGVVLNRPSDVPVASVLPTWQAHVTGLPTVFQGGPVSLDSALALAACPRPEPDEPAGFRRVAGVLGLVDLDAPPEAVSEGLSALRIFAGYAGWAPGQLDGELDEGAWFVCDARASDAFTDDAEGLWRSVLRRQPAPMSFVHTYPADPSDN